MNIKNRKTIVSLIINIQLVILFLFLLFFSPDTLETLGGTIILSLVGNGAMYIGGNVFHAWQKSKFYQIELDSNIQNKSEMNIG